MQFAKINRTNLETVYITGRNVGANSLTTGYAVAMASHPASVSRGGMALKIGTTTDPGEFIGVADQDIVANAVGRVVVWGYAASVLISTSIGNHTSILPGHPLVLGATLASAFVSGQAPAYANGGFKYLINLVTVNVSTAGPTGAAWTSGFMKGGL